MKMADYLQLVGAFCFGALLGWYLYYINRYRKEDVKLGDLTSLVGVIGGGAVLVLFPAGTELFGAYGIGLAFGFFGYFVVLMILVKISPNFNREWFLDGRRKMPDGTILVPQEGAGGHAMAVTPAEKGFIK
jgi:hypothetical protein